MAADAGAPASGGTQPEVDVRFLDSESWDASMPERLRWLRENDPVRWSEKDGLWLIAKFEDVSWVSKHQQLFTSAHGVRPGNPVKLGLIDEGEPRHGQLRRLINRGFTPRMVGQLEVIFREITKETLDRIAARGECDFVEDVAVPLPLLLIAEMIGIRREDRVRFHHWSDAMIAAEGNLGDPDIMQAAAAAYLEYATYVTEIIEDRRKSPRDDLVSILTGAKDEGLLTHFESPEVDEPVPDDEVELHNDELIKLLVLLLVAGNETTRNAISGGMQLLIENPEERAKLIADASRIPAAVEEMLRMVSPVHSFSRTVTENTELRGRKLESGQQVLMLYPSANRDAEVFEDPDVFRVDRNPHHLGFGIGTHFCLGANLARMEMRVAFEELLRRLPDMEYADDGPVIRPSALVRSCTRMRVRFSPESGGAPIHR
jgi:cytochrome P450 family 142 subfamily A polypeptide 1